MAEPSRSTSLLPSPTVEPVEQEEPRQGTAGTTTPSLNLPLPSSSETSPLTQTKMPSGKSSPTSETCHPSGCLLIPRAGASRDSDTSSSPTSSLPRRPWRKVHRPRESRSTEGGSDWTSRPRKAAEVAIGEDEAVEGAAEGEAGEATEVEGEEEGEATEEVSGEDVGAAEEAEMTVAGVVEGVAATEVAAEVTGEDVEEVVQGKASLASFLIVLRTTV